VEREINVRWDRGAVGTCGFDYSCIVRSSSRLTSRQQCRELLFTLILPLLIMMFKVNCAPPCAHKSTCFKQPAITRHFYIKSGLFSGNQTQTFTKNAFEGNCHLPSSAKDGRLWWNYFPIWKIGRPCFPCVQKTIWPGQHLGNAINFNSPAVRETRISVIQSIASLIFTTDIYGT
jgi:hypothetical protein